MAVPKWRGESLGCSGEVDTYISCGGDIANLVSAQLTTKEDTVDTPGNGNNIIAVAEGGDDNVAAPATQEGEE